MIPFNFQRNDKEIGASDFGRVEALQATEQRRGATFVVIASESDQPVGWLEDVRGL